MIKTQEIHFNCNICDGDLYYMQELCEGCNSVIKWQGKAIRITKVYEDKYHEAFEVYL